MMLARFQHLLVPLDFTNKNQPALEIAFEIAVQNQARVTLLHVIETLSELEDRELTAFYDRLAERANRELESFAQRFQEAKLPVDWKVRYGKRLTEIVDDIEERAIDLLVMSSHKVSREEPLKGLGSLSYQVSLLCECPVLMVK
ncbi:MAG: universal stress protein [Planctomycetaceae bacterium]|nr:universal stress protein [Planctomycetaceae bacterium]